MRGLGKKEKLIRGKRKRSEERRRIGSTRKKKIEEWTNNEGKRNKNKDRIGKIYEYHKEREKERSR